MAQPLRLPSPHSCGDALWAASQASPRVGARQTESLRHDFQVAASNGFRTATAPALADATSSTLMQLFPPPADHSACPPARSTLGAVEEPPLGLHGIRIPIHDFANSVNHQAGHRGHVDPKTPEQSLGQAERDVLVGQAIHSFQCVT